MWVESCGFPPRQWKLYPWLVSVLAELVPWELVSFRLLEQGVSLKVFLSSASRGNAV